jgi:hypothetical protein
MPNDAQLKDFIAWYAEHISGDEKGEAQVFLDRLFLAFGQGGTLNVGGKPEYRVRKPTESGGGISFADYVWKPIVLIEMKKRGAALQKHRRQAFDYWANLVPDRPRYVVLCNFDEFWIYDFDTDIDEPKDKVATKELAARWGALAFLAPGTPPPVFRADRVAVTRQAADVLARILTSLLHRNVDRALAQTFLVQNLIALFSEDIGLLPKYFYTRLLDDCTTPVQAYDLLGGLFEAMNSPTPAPGGRFKEVQYFNGGLFARPAHIELTLEELTTLKTASREYDWSKVQPEIFGAVFQDSLDAADRRRLGAHFTHPADIMKIVGPTIVQPWRAKVESATTLKALNEALSRLHNFRVLDPACGSGNFLYIAYRELKRIEARIVERQQTEFRREAAKAAQLQLSFLSAKNFFGIDIHPLAVEIAKVTMVIARKLASDELHTTENALPLDNLDGNFLTADGILSSAGIPTQWPKADVIIGNPPFVGAKWLRKARGTEYVRRLRAAYPSIPGMADYCVYWLRRANDVLVPCTKEDPVAGRAGLVGTQNIRHNKSRVGGLDHIVSTGTIVEAVDNQPWPGEANVNVSIVNWAKTKEQELLPKKKRLWFKVDVGPGSAAAIPEAHRFELDYRETAFITSSLTDTTDVSGAVVLACNVKPQRVYQGITPGHSGFVLTPTDRKALVAKDAASASVIFPYLVGRELVSGDGTPGRFVIDFGTRTVLEAQAFTEAFARVVSTVLPARQIKAEDGKSTAGEYQVEHRQALDRWWRLWRDREDMKRANAKLRKRYIAGSRTQRWPFIFCFVSKDVLAGDKLQTFAFDDDYSFGVLQAAPHLAWYAAKAARLKNEVDFNYSAESVFDTYPWPQAPTKRQVEAVAAAAQEVRRVRTHALPVKGGLRGLYRTLGLPGVNPLKDAHKLLDEAVLEAYGFRKKKDLLGQILELNAEVHAQIGAGNQVVGPGVPRDYPKTADLVSCDCVGAPPLAGLR